MLPSARKPEARLRPESNLKTRPEDDESEAARHEEDDKKKTNRASQVMSPKRALNAGSNDTMADRAGSGLIRLHYFAPPS